MFSSLSLGHVYHVSMALGIYHVPYSDRNFCLSVGPGFASLGTSR